jgi:hypothetical protein
MNPSFIYTPGIHRAPVFSLDIYSSCHPGLYFKPEKVAGDITVLVDCAKGAICVGGKYRCAEFEVMPNDWKEGK